MVISLIVTGVAFSIYRLNASYYLREDAYLQQYQNLRVALYTVGRDVRMAGNGFALLGADLRLIQAYTPTREKATTGAGHPPSEIVNEGGWFRNLDTTTTGVRAIFGQDGGANYPDTLTVFRAEVESGNPLSTVQSVSGNRLTLNKPIPKEALKSGDIVALGSGSNGIVLETGNLSLSGDVYNDIVIKPGGRFTNSSPFLPTGFDPVGAYVYNFRDIGLITYWVDTENNALMAAYHDTARTGYDDSTGTSSIVASNIEDFQVYYYLDDDIVDFADTDAAPIMSSAVLSGARRVKAVSLGLVARSPYGDGPVNRKRPALFNREEGTVADNRLRNVLIETIYLRNFHI
jgi:hypothetical protein